ncbi:class I SAM-dependent methyltransferase [Caminibacter sp.]
MTDWNVDLYKKHANFVSNLAIDVVELLNPKKNEKILDVGCGDGTLGELIEKKGAKVIGIDKSKNMIKKAKEKIEAYNIDVIEMNYKNEFDAVFSNAVLHWINDQKKALANIYKALKNNGRFVCEFGGKGNIDSLLNAIENVFIKYKFGKFKNPWYFPDVKSYKNILESEGFSVEYIELIPRPTKINDIKKWIDIFCKDFTENLTKEQKNVFKNEVEKILRDKIYTKTNEWIVDYVRIRFKAIKKEKNG